MSAPNDHPRDDHPDAEPAHADPLRGHPARGEGTASGGDGSVSGNREHSDGRTRDGKGRNVASYDSRGSALTSRDGSGRDRRDAVSPSGVLPGAVWQSGSAQGGAPDGRASAAASSSPSGRPAGEGADETDSHGLSGRNGPSDGRADGWADASGPGDTGSGGPAQGGGHGRAKGDGRGGGQGRGQGHAAEPAGKGHRNHRHRHRRSAQARPLQGTDVVRSGRDRAEPANAGPTKRANEPAGGRPSAGQRPGRGAGTHGASASASASAAGLPTGAHAAPIGGASGRAASQQSGHSGHQRFEQGGAQPGSPAGRVSGSSGNSSHPAQSHGHGYGPQAGSAARGAAGSNAGYAASSFGRRADAFEGDDAGPMPLYAALDLGTNNCRLLIAQPTRPGQFRVVDGFSRIVRLGEGLAASGRLSEDAMNRSVEALKICAAKLGHRNIRRARLIATEAARAAENGVVFMERVSAETGLELEIIDRETEARLAVSGCASLVGREARSVVLFDIGGGSSEIAVLRIGDNRSSRLANHITHWTSLPVGVVTLSERHGGRDVTPESFEGMIREVSGMLDRFDCPDIEEVRAAEDFHLIGTSGTVTTLAGVHLDLPRYDRRRVDGLWLSDDEVSAMQARLLSWDFAARAANPCIGPDRADLVLAGCAILEAIRRRWPSTRMRVADRGLREGLLTDMMADDGVWRRGRGRRPSRSGPQTGSEEGRSS
ncbi:Ppx/GppA phosphatase family protein [Rhizobium sp. PP-F2F-G48]|uniref:Ppx/GppA phosphatase family protein n=1 Tax=Rhizobium sp. PP-F2F-G48 TaxID=2135651 RepID=UPI001FE232EF|nr:Ppx/GppA phosphatase family protein [Rhizobium sp. PP-F2F-G48]